MADTLNEQLNLAQREAGGLRDRLSRAETDLAEALEERRYADAETLKGTADSLRQPAMIAQAHVQALETAVRALQEHQEQEERAARERQRRDQAAAMYEQAREAEAAALDDVARHMAEVPVAYEALQQAMAAAMAAEIRVGGARRDAHTAGVGAGHLPADYPVPPIPNNARARFEQHPLLGQILRNPRLS
ncbi:hypothetical protein [Kitasatospora sp. NBC_01302]|uniref:hypothetical protein n=1 Tax=Kitasatospora sp. NBC_01302 TaxID=2903575 RepID=UPI002E0DB981|nr:hypothetical protein OG294_27760 [Kitasatospora sp. NBC_01302]